MMVSNDYETVNACPACGHTESESSLEYRWTEKAQKRFAAQEHKDRFNHLSIRRCCNCGMEFQSPRPTEASLLSTIDNVYPLRAMTPARKQVFERDLVILQRHLPTGSAIFDVGCNTGEFLNLAKSHYRVGGCDLNSRAVEFGKKEFGLDLQVGTLESMSLQLYDASISLDSFEHFHQPRQFLEEAAKRLKPNGILYVRTLRSESLNARLSGRNWHAYAIWHLTYPKSQHLQQMFAKHDFDTLEVVVFRSEWDHFKDFVKHQAKHFASSLFPITQSLRNFREDLKQDARIFSQFRDECAIIGRKRA